jgi:enoyl-CoA hydratase
MSFTEADRRRPFYAPVGRFADMPVEYDREGPVAVVTVDRPDRRNAIDDATAEALGNVWARFEEDDDALVGVLTGSEGTFSAGADLEAMDLEDRPEGWLGFTRTRVSKPTVAAVEGYCVAGGLEMALWCDLRVAGDSATFGCFERRFGVPLVDGGTQRLPHVVGLGRALDLILTGRALDAETAEEWGLVNRLAPDGEALDAAVELAEVIAAFPQETVRTDRAAVYDGLGATLDQGLAIEGWHGSRAMDTAVEGAARFAAGEGRGGEGIPDEE